MVEIHQQDLNPVLNSFTEGICYLNAQGELLYYNEAAKSHWTAQRLLSNHLPQQSSVARGLAGEHITHELVHLGERHALLVNVLPLHQGTNAVTGVVIVSQDVTEHVLLEQEADISLHVLLEAILSTSDTGDIDETLRRLAALIPQLESVDNSMALRVNEDDRRILPIALFGQSQQSSEEWHAELAAIKLNTEDALQKSSPAFMQTLRLGRPLMFDFASTPSLHNPRKLRAAIYAPVLLDGHVIGLLGAERHRPLRESLTYFPQWSVSLLTALARLASISIEKSVLLNSIERLQGELETARALLSQKDEFLSIATHELKNPLTAIRGQAQVLRRRVQKTLHVTSDQTTHDLLRGLASIDHQTRRIEHMINNLMNVNRIDLDRFEVELREIDLARLAQRTLEEQLPFAQKHELRLFVNGKAVPIETGRTPPEPPIKVQGDEEQLEEILANLVTNAIKYSPEDTPITVSLRDANNGSVELSVEDRGIGIPPEEQTKLTERFYRAANVQNTGTPGLGLGLYLVNVLVAKHNGIFSIRSSGIPGKGSTFTVRLPRQQS